MAEGPRTKVGKLDSDHSQFREGYEFAAVCSCGWASFGWPMKKQAQMRIDSHKEEHANASHIRELLDKGEVEEASKLMMPPKDEVEALTPDLFPVAVREPNSDDVNGAWDAVK